MFTLPVQIECRETRRNDYNGNQAYNPSLFIVLLFSILYCIPLTLHNIILINFWEVCGECGDINKIPSMIRHWICSPLARQSVFAPNIRRGITIGEFMIHSSFLLLAISPLYGCQYSCWGFLWHLIHKRATNWQALGIWFVLQHGGMVAVWQWVGSTRHSKRARERNVSQIRHLQFDIRMTDLGPSFFLASPQSWPNDKLAWGKNRGRGKKWNTTDEWWRIPRDILQDSVDDSLKFQNWNSCPTFFSPKESSSDTQVGLWFE